MVNWCWIEIGWHLYSLSLFNPSYDLQFSAFANTVNWLGLIGLIQQMLIRMNDSVPTVFIDQMSPYSIICNGMEYTVLFGTRARLVTVYYDTPLTPLPFFCCCCCSCLLTVTWEERPGGRRHWTPSTHSHCHWHVPHSLIHIIIHGWHVFITDPFMSCKNDASVWLDIMPYGDQCCAQMHKHKRNTCWITILICSIIGLSIIYTIPKVCLSLSLSFFTLSFVHVHNSDKVDGMLHVVLVQIFFFSITATYALLLGQIGKNLQLVVLKPLANNPRPPPHSTKSEVQRSPLSPAHSAVRPSVIVLFVGGGGFHCNNKVSVLA